MLVTMWLLLVCGKQECLVVGPLCDMGLPRFQQAVCMNHLGFLPCPAGLDLWMKPMVRPEDVFDYYAYVLIYAGDVMVIHNDT